MTAENTSDIRQKRRFAGVVVRNKNDKTVVIEVAWTQKHRIYKKAQRRITRLVAHDEQNQASIGDRVIVEAARPLSATKRWRLVEVTEKRGIKES